jgi:hypothetical protein
MSQQINLYRPATKRRELSFNGTHLLLGILGVVVAHIIYGGIIFGQHYSITTQLAELEAQKITIMERRDKLSQQLTQYTSTSVNEEIEKIEHLLANRKQIYEKLHADTFSTGNGYSGYFVAFARQHIAGLWLTDISLGHAGRELVLRGQTTAAHLVPKYLKKLSAEALLAGTNLSDFQLDRPVEDEQTNIRANYINFKISTNIPPEDAL